MKPPAKTPPSQTGSAAKPPAEAPAAGAASAVPAPAWPISHVLTVANLPTRPMTVALAPNVEERAAIARFLKIVAVDALEADVVVEPRGARVRVGGLVRATVRQACVVTLEPVSEQVEEPIEIVFAPAEEASAAEAKAHAAALKAEQDGRLEDLAELLGAENLPDPIIDGAIDLGGVVVETLALGLDPYPRKEGAVFVQPDSAGGDVSPFSALKALKDKS